MARLPTSRPLPTVVLRHKVSGVKRIMNAAEYALKVGGISRNWKLVEYRGVDTPDAIIQRELRQAEIEWEKTRSGRDDRPQRRYEDRAIHQNIVVPKDDEPAPPAPAPANEPVAASGSPVETPQEPAPDAGSPAVKRGPGRPRKNPT